MDAFTDTDMERPLAIRTVGDLNAALFFLGITPEDIQTVIGFFAWLSKLQDTAVAARVNEWMEAVPPSHRPF